MNIRVIVLLSLFIVLVIAIIMKIYKVHRIPIKDKIFYFDNNASSTSTVILAVNLTFYTS
jgi:hypothetical protein